ncbi:hypothetical protein TWF481_006224 [Arthrobotrys musiformis]|uniref:non-specific serine/threonine protein kinase n=1 Tax=Arthrobotrys musiformis TaxID=47236 RepID=A0AAV9WHP3_9PEZI
MGHIDSNLEKLDDVGGAEVLYIYPGRRRLSTLFPANKSQAKLVPNISGNQSDRRQRAIVLSLSNPPRNIKKGWVFGTDPTSADVILNKAPRISKEHFIIGFNHDSGVLIFTDCSEYGSFYSTNSNEINPVKLYRETIALNQKACIIVGPYCLYISSPQSEENDKKFQRALMEKLGTQFSGTASPIIPGALHVAEELLPEFAIGKTIHQPRCSKYHVSVVTRMSTGDKYIAKIFRKECDFSQELQLLKDLRHENIISASDIIDRGLNTFALMPCAKGSLSDFDCTAWDFGQKQTLATQLSDGLNYLHDLQTAHGDIKPANILVFCLDPLRLKICDLGSAIKTNTTTLKVGTLSYAAPEIRLKRAPDPQMYTDEYHVKPTDIWSLGLVLLECYEKAPKSCRNYVWGQHHENLAKKALAYAARQDIISLLISKTIKTVPEDRITAADCWRICQETTAPSYSAETHLSSTCQTLSLRGPNCHEPSELETTYEVVTTTIQIETRTYDADPLTRAYNFGQRHSFMRPATECSSTFMQSTQIVTISTETIARFPATREATQLVSTRTTLGEAGNETISTETIARFPAIIEATQVLSTETITRFPSTGEAAQVVSTETTVRPLVDQEVMQAISTPSLISTLRQSEASIPDPIYLQNILASGPMDPQSGERIIKTKTESASFQIAVYEAKAITAFVEWRAEHNRKTKKSGVASGNRPASRIRKSGVKKGIKRL